MSAIPTPSGPAALPTTELRSPELPAMAPAPVKRAQKFHLLLSELMTTSAGNHMATATLWPVLFRPEVLAEFFAFQKAVMARIDQQNRNWVESCAAVAQEYSQLGAANTLSKLVEQEYNVFAQFHAVAAAQAASWAGLMENVQVDYAYWIAQKQAQAEEGQGFGRLPLPSWWQRQIK